MDKAISNWFITDGDCKYVPKFIIAVSSIEPRKNYFSLINCWKRLILETGVDIKLLIVGNYHGRSQNVLDEIASLAMHGQIIHLANVLQSEISYLYSAASMYVSASIAEGFGLPTLEAAQCGCPLVLSDIQAYRSVARDSAVYFNPYDEDVCVDAMKKIVNNPELQKDLVAKSLVNLQRFSSEYILKQWEGLFEELSKKVK
jgi:glycosyltransferase involved in cell wall biosynthesis